MDELFALNLAIDYFLLLATAQVCALPLRRGRFALSAAFGSLWCCVSLLQGFAWLDSSVMKGVLALAMCLAAFGRDGRLWRSFGVFGGLSVLFGGAVWAAGLHRGVWRTDGRLVKLDMRTLMLAFAVCWVGVKVIFRRGAKRAEQAAYDVVIERGERSVRLRALHDTGNGLYDPVSGRHVLVAEARALAPLFSPAETAALMSDAVDAVRVLRGFHLIPYASLGGSGLLPCFRPDRVTVDNAARDDLAVAVTAAPLGGDCRAIL